MRRQENKQDAWSPSKGRRPHNEVVESSLSKGHFVSSICSKYQCSECVQGWRLGGGREACPEMLETERIHKASERETTYAQITQSLSPVGNSGPVWLA